MHSCQFIMIKLFTEHLFHSALSDECECDSVSLSVCLFLTLRGNHFWDHELESMNIPSSTFFLWGLSCRQRAHDCAESMGLPWGLPEAGWGNLPHSWVCLEVHLSFTYAFQPGLYNTDAILTSIFIPFLFTWFSQPRHQMWGCWVYC